MIRIADKYAIRVDKFQYTSGLIIRALHTRDFSRELNAYTI